MLLFLFVLFLAVGLGVAVPLTIQTQTAFASNCTTINDEPTIVCAGGGSATDQGINGGGGGNRIIEGDLFTGSWSGGSGNGDVRGGEGEHCTGSLSTGYECVGTPDTTP